VPILVILAEKDEYGDRPANIIGKWFKEATKAGNLEVGIVRGAVHNLTEQETEVEALIRKWAK
jgi:pimeloyl-ACP methyl ester carboxylesterase